MAYEDVSGEDLDNFFDVWVHQPVKPYVLVTTAASELPECVSRTAKAGLP